MELTEQGKKNIQEFGRLIGSITAYNWFLHPDRRSLDERIDPKQEELKKVMSPNDRTFQDASNDYFHEAIGIGRTLGVGLDEWPFPDYEIKQDLAVDQAHLRYFSHLCDMEVHPRTIIVQAYGVHAGRLEQHFKRKHELIWERERTNRNTGLNEFQEGMCEGRKDYTIARKILMDIVDPQHWTVDLGKWFEVLGYFHHGPQLETVNEEVLKELFSR